MVKLVAAAVVLLAGIYMLGFGALAIAAPLRAGRYLQGFASTLRLHAAELAARAVVGISFIAYASSMRFGGTFDTIGLILLATTLGLALLPWRWHRKIAQTSIPLVSHYLPLIGVVAMAAGTFIFWSVVAGPAR